MKFDNPDKNHLMTKLIAITMTTITLPGRFEPADADGVILRKPVERVKRAQSKIYEEDDINIWDDDSKTEDTLIMENGQVSVVVFDIRLGWCVSI